MTSRADTSRRRSIPARSMAFCMHKSLNGCSQPQAPLLDDQAAIFHVEQPGLLGDGACLRRGDAQLQPQGRGASRHGLAGEIRRLLRRPEYIDQACLAGDVPQRRVGTLAENDVSRSEEHTSELQSPCNLVCRLLLEKK